MDEPRGAPGPLPRSGLQSPDPLIGRVINDRYRIVGTIARGGMGKVYRAEQQPLGRLVALKVLNPNYMGEHDPEFHRRFFLEASIASKLTHPNTVTVFDYGKTDDEVFYIAMELLEGRTLHRTLREEGPFSAERTMHIARQICRSLREAHALGVIHRDLKPANIYLMQHGDENDFVKVLDFGLVKNLDDKGGEELTQTGLFMGSPKYMSPEQIRGDRVDGRVDVYALGVIMFEMLTGRVPYDRANSVNILMAHIQEDIPAMSVFNPRVQVPPQLESVVRRCMAKEADQRYATMEDVLVALKQCAGISATMSGELRLEDVMGPGGFGLSALRPSAANANVSPDLTSGLVTPVGVRPAEASAPLSAALPAAPRRGHAAWVALGALAAAAAAAVGFGLWDGESAASVRAKAAPAASSAAAQRGEPQLGAPSAPLGASAAADPSVATATVLVSLKSTPPGAMVLVGEREYGPTPTQIEWTGDEATVGREVTFRFQRKGYRDLTVTRQIRGDVLEVDAPAMDPIPVMRPRHPEPRESPAPSKAPAPPSNLEGYKAEPY